MITTYIGPRLYPGALTDCAAAVLKTVSRAGVWMPSPSDLNYDQLKALLLLRNTGYIEYASFGGYRVKANQFTIVSEKVTPQPREAIESITVGPLCVVVIFADGTHARHRAGTPEYEAYKARTRDMGKGVTLAGNDNTLAFGNTDRLLGKWKIGG